MHRQRVSRFEQLLRPTAQDTAATSVDDGELGGTREELRELCLGGIPDNPPFLRPTAYRALLNLPSSALDQYSAFVDEISRRVSEGPPPVANERPSAQDKLLPEIERDVERTFGGLAWFGGAPADEAVAEEDPLWARIALLDALDEAKARSLAESANAPTSPPGEGDSTTSSSRPSTRRQALLRPLFVYAMLNPGLSYVQGMNSLVAVFLFIFSAEGTSFLEAEAKAFFALGAILSQLRDLYVPSLDATSSPRNSLIGSPHPTGLGATLARFTSLLTWLDPAVADRLESKEIDPALYCFRWITTLFANEFQLPDLVRVWDRVISLFPSEVEPQAGEALSPVLGHLIDISLAMVLMERPTIVSPYSTFPKIIARLQDPQIDGEQVDKLLSIAWEIRERRLGKAKRVSAPEGAPNWRSAANKWAAAAQTAASNASASPTASSLRSRFWSTPTTPTRSSSAAAAEFELDETASQADSEASTSGTPLFASKGQRIGNIAEEVTTIDGKVLPPPPARIDEQVTLAELIEAEMPKELDDDEDNYGYDDLEAPTLKERAANSWGGWKNSLSRLAASDAAAALSKRQTNLAIQAQILRDQLAEQAPDRIAKLKETVSGASGRLMASGHAERGPRRDGSPSETPFTPPRFGDRRPTSPAPFTPEGAPAMEKSWSGGGPRPLLLSGSARRASNASNPDSSTSPPGSRRSSGAWRSPSISPTFVRPSLPPLNDLPVPIGSLARSTSRGSHGRSASSFSPSTASTHSLHARSASTAPSSATSYASDDLPIHSLRLHSPVGSPIAEAPPARLRRPIARHAASSESAVPAANGRGWTLSDAPIRPPAPAETPSVVEPTFDPSTLTESRPAFASATPPPPSDSPISIREEGTDAFHSAASSIPPSPPVEEETEQTLPNSNGVDDSIRNMFANADDHEPVSDSVRAMFAHTDHSPETPIKALPPRGSSLADSSPTSPPPRQSSLGAQDLSISTSSLPSSSPAIDEDKPLSAVVGDSPLAPTRSKIVRRPGALKKRTSGRGSISGSIDLSAADRRSVSEFLVGGAHSRAGSEDGEGMSRRGSARSKRTSVGSQFTTGRQSVFGWDEEDLLNAYGEEEGEEVLSK